MVMFLNTVKYACKKCNFAFNNVKLNVLYYNYVLLPFKLIHY